MVEKINRQYLPGMDEILSINKHSRFINLLAILRRSETRDGDNTSKDVLESKRNFKFGDIL